MLVVNSNLLHWILFKLSTFAVLLAGIVCCIVGVLPASIVVGLMVPVAYTQAMGFRHSDEVHIIA